MKSKTKVQDTEVGLLVQPRWFCRGVHLSYKRLNKSKAEGGGSRKLSQCGWMLYQQLYVLLTYDEVLLSHFANEEMEAQREQITCPRSHG